ncbi:hypothetical protein L1987_06878 [Smallanthus sonchifolius]|uniref:Uncharacterized protein n=1 Tax=Smallanthus sonchifolius TaxID=185202 RepID=A0ACB9JZL6_9ASTR|nr:hypothetical protein L1987_06878 [Smallanthus sonchifolius]
MSLVNLIKGKLLRKDDNGITYEDDSGFEITYLPMKDIETPEVSFKSIQDQVFDDQDPEISKPTSPSTTIPDSAPTEPVQQEETPQLYKNTGMTKDEWLKN